MAKIIVVDDSVSNLLLLKDILLTNQFEVVTETLPEKVVPRMLEEEFDLVLLDIMMPKIDGFEVCRRIKEEAKLKHIPVIFLTAKIDNQSLLTGFKVGGVDYIKKPFLIDELLARVNSQVNLKISNDKFQKEVQLHLNTKRSLEVSKTELQLRNVAADIMLNCNTLEVYNNLIEGLKIFFNADAGLIGILDDENNLFCPNINKTFEFNKNYTALNRCVNEKVTVLSGGGNVKVFYSDEVYSFMGITPMFYNHKVIGVISFVGKNQDPPSYFVETLEKLSNYISPIIQSRIAADKYDKARTKAEELLKVSEHKYRTLFNQNNDAVMIYQILEDNNLKIIQVNNTFEKLFSINQYDILEYEPFALFNQEKRELVKEKFDLAVLGKEQNLESLMITSQGKTIPVELDIKKFKRSQSEGLMVVIRDISQRIEFNDRILRAVVETSEKERNRFAKDIHDGIGALLSSISMYLNLLEKGMILDNEIVPTYQTIKTIIAETVMTSKEIANDLRPDILTNFGLIATVETLAKRLSPKGNPTIKIVPNNLSEPKSEIQTALYRICSELLNNMIKYSKAKNVLLDFSQDENYIKLNYKDDGIGFDLPKVLEDIKLKVCSGISNIQARVKNINGQVDFITSINKGLNVIIHIPR